MKLHIKEDLIEYLSGETTEEEKCFLNVQFTYYMFEQEANRFHVLQVLHSSLIKISDFILSICV